MSRSRRPSIPEDCQFSPTEAARLIGKSRAIVYRYIQRGEIETTRDEDGLLQISGAELERWLGSLPTITSDAPLLLQQAVRRERGRAAGYWYAATHTKEEIAAPMQRGRWASLERQVDPEGKLDTAERSRRAEALQRAQLARMRAARHEKAIRREQYGRKSPK